MSDNPPQNSNAVNLPEQIRERLTLLNTWLHHVATDGGEDELTCGWPTMGRNAVRIVFSCIFIYILNLFISEYWFSSC